HTRFSRDWSSDVCSSDLGAYDPERVQLCVQAMILEEHGYTCNEGILYYTASKERVRVVFDDELRAMTRAAVDGLRLIAVGGRIRSEERRVGKECRARWTT